MGGAQMQTTPLLEGGSAEDQQRLLALHEEWLAANSRLDTGAARRLMTSDPTAVFYNINGHTYVGVEHWCRLWDYYRTQFETLESWTACDVKLTIRGDMALITAMRTARLRQIGGDVPSSFVTGERAVFRGTLVFVREAGDWKIIHGHFAHTSDGPRPGGI
jgi:ketosteroid isomerase-like protein